MAISFSSFSGFVRKRKLPWRSLLIWGGLCAFAFLTSRVTALLVVPETVFGGRMPATGPATGAPADPASPPPAVPGIDTSAIDNNNLMALKTHGAKAAPPPPPPPPPPTFGAALLGTMGNFEQGNALVIVQFQGQQHVLRQGESLAGFTLIKVDRREALFQGFDQKVLLTVDSPDAPRPVILP